MKQESKAKKEISPEKELEKVLKRLLQGNTVKREDRDDYEEIKQHYNLKLRHVVCALFALKAPPFNKAIGPEMARDCANFLFELRRSGSGNFCLASNNELAAAAKASPSTFSNWRSGQTEKSRAADGFCAFLQTCKVGLSFPQEEAETESYTDTETETDSSDEDSPSATRPKTRKGEGYIYIMQDKPRRFKVGSSKDPESRLKQLQTGNVDLKLLHTEHVSSRMFWREKQVHRDLDAYRILVDGCCATEWYGKGCTLEQIKKIIRRHAWENKYQNYIGIIQVVVIHTVVDSGLTYVCIQWSLECFFIFLIHGFTKAVLYRETSLCPSSQYPSVVSLECQSTSV